MTLSEPAFVGFPFESSEGDASPLPTDGLRIWLDATWGIVLDGATTRVANWTGRKGSTGSQATTAAMPILAAGSQNGRPGVRFDGADDALGLAPAPTFANGITMFAIVNFADFSDNRYVLTSSAAGGVGYAASTAGPGFPLLFKNQQGAIGAFSTVAPSAGTAVQLTATWDRNGGTAGPYALRMNGTENRSGTVDVAPVTATTDRVGAGLGPGAMGGLIHELIVYDRALFPSEIAAAETYLRRKWGTA